MAQEKPDKSSYQALEELLTGTKNKETTAQEQTDVLNKASESAYQKQQLANQQAQNQYAQNTAASQMSALDAIRKSNASSIANGANAGLAAANQLSSILGLQETTSEEATKLANADLEAAAQFNNQLNQNAVAGQKAANDYNLGLGANQAELGKAIAELEKAEAQKYAADRSAESTDKGIEVQKETNATNKKSVDNAQREANYNKIADALDNITKDWQTGDARTFFTSYIDPFSKEGVKVTGGSIGDNPNPKGGEAFRLQQVASKLKAEIAAAYASGDKDEINKWTNKANEFIRSIQTAEDNCLIPGTKISMADGSFKNVEDVEAGDLVLVWNLEKGCLDISPILLNDKDKAGKHKVIQLTFSNGSKVGIIYEHGFFDKDTMRYEYIHSLKEAEALIGHHFLRHVDNGLVETILVRAEVYTATIPTYSPCSVKHLCIFAEGILTMPGATEPFNNFIKIDKETMAYDKEDLEAGLKAFDYCPYQEVAVLFKGATKELYEAFQMKYFRINLGRGHAHLRTIKQLMVRYKKYL